MNYHSDEWIMKNVQEHYKESLEHFSENRIVGIFYQGSGNYGLDYEDSDVDTKLIIVPTFKDIAMNKQPISTTHVRANDEHTDWKDIRLYMQTFRKQNLNFLEILFTPYKIINPLYEKEWKRLEKAKEEIARYNEVAAIKAMRGMAKEKYFAMEHHYPSRMDWIDKFGYDPKQLHHLLRIGTFLERFIDGKSYIDCMTIGKDSADYLVKVKRGEAYTLGDARWFAKATIDQIDEMCDKFLETCNKDIDEKVDNLLNDVQYNIMKIAVEEELK